MRTIKRVAPPAPTPYQHGEVVTPDADGRCGRCGYANFRYSNGHEVAADGTRGYRCVNCGCIKSEAWCRARHKAHPYKHRIDP